MTALNDHCKQPSFFVVNDWVRPFTAGRDRPGKSIVETNVHAYGAHDALRRPTNG
jgi:hypothetical protein